MDELEGELTQVPESKSFEQIRNSFLKKLQKENDEKLKILLQQKHGFPIPTFHSEIPDPKDQLKCLIHDKARQVSDMYKTIDLMESDELEALYEALEKHATPPIGNAGSTELYIGYKDYAKLLPTLSERALKLLNATVFLKLINPNDRFGRVEITAIYNYCVRKTWLRRTRIELDRYDMDGSGLIDEYGIKEYIKNSLVPVKPFFAQLDSGFLRYYNCNVVRKFMFFLDPNKTGKVKIIEVLACSFLDDLYEVADELNTSPSNWFTYESFKRVYLNFMAMDEDRKGALSPEQLKGYGNDERSFTQTFVKRVFEENCPANGGMDYVTYLDLSLALDHPKERRSIDYFFRVLDVHHQGYLDENTLHYFFQDIVEMCTSQKSWTPSFTDLRNEIFDMVKPEDPFKITVKDLVKSGCASTVFNTLTDFLGFLSTLNK